MPRSHSLDEKFAALSHPVRRAIMERIAEEPQTLTELARPCAMSVPAVAKHVKVLENAGLLEKGERSSTRLLSGVPGSLDELARWLLRNREFWNGSFDRLEAQIRRERH